MRAAATASYGMGETIPRWDRSRPMSATAGRAASGFSRPARSSQGSAALAALFDSYEDEAIEDESATGTYFGAAPEADIDDRDERIIEADWHEIGPAGNQTETVDERIDAALTMPAIARLVSQHEHGPGQEPLTPPRPGTATGKAGSRSEMRAPPNESLAAETDAPSENSPGAFRSVVRGLVALMEGVADRADGVLGTLLRGREARVERLLTPGDRKVSEWRMEQLRRARRRMTPKKFLGWAGFYAAIAAVAYAGIFMRTDIAQAWPQAGAAYTAFGMIGGPEPVEISTITHRYARSPQGPVIELAGSVSHQGRDVVKSPLIRADALDPDGRVLSSWAFRLEGAGQLSPQSETPFRTRALAPAGTAQVRIDVMNAEERAALERSQPEVIAALEGGLGGNAYFMRKTTSGWGEAQQPAPLTRMRD
ncbi:hypothetical protein GCM10011342_19030 [Aquisalinus flavus]|uniref:Uncharacterized protein n=2 Tax=Aquisalinus flavus TaxID=1526572 RepID=A0A8J2V696_9PROT|nr:hypothetical protein GCM10011342_19030 [Aquisalinus flavus]